MNVPVLSEPIDNSFCPVIQVQHLSRRIHGKVVLDDVNLSVNSGEVFGLIGPDAAGKTTLFNVLMGFMTPQNGSARLFGKHPDQCRTRVSYLTQKFSCYPDLTVQENLAYFATLRGVSRDDRQLRQSKYLGAVDLARFADRRARALSGGMKQKLALCCALISEPEVLLLDEPTTGVDPVARREFWDVLLGLGSGITTFISTPYLEEAERCHRVALIHQGKITDIGPVDQLKSSLGVKRITLTAPDLADVSSLLHDASKCRDSVLKQIQVVGARIDLLTGNTDKAQREIAQALGAQRMASMQENISLPTLESVFASRVAPDVPPQAISELPTTAPNDVSCPGPAILAHKLRKQFDEFVAVDDIDLQIPFGTIYGLLGANGAGKTTSIKLLCGLLPPTSGKKQLLGLSDTSSRSIRQHIGYMSQQFTLYEDLTITENLDFYAGVYGVPPHLRKHAIEWVIDFAQLQDYADALTGQISAGLKQRVSLGACIMHQPRVIFLDEPTSGMDPLARRSTWTLIRKLACQGAAILVSTHYMDEAENCHQIGFMADGKLLISDTPENIRKAQKGNLYEVRTDNNRAGAAIIKQIIAPWKVAIFANSIHVNLESTDPALHVVAERLIDNHIKVLGTEQIPFSLEDAFIRTISFARNAQP